MLTEHTEEGKDAAVQRFDRVFWNVGRYLRNRCWLRGLVFGRDVKPQLAIEGWVRFRDLSLVYNPAVGFVTRKLLRFTPFQTLIKFRCPVKFRPIRESV